MRMTDKNLNELAKWLFSILILSIIALAVFLFLILFINYPGEFLIGLFIFTVVAAFRYSFFV